MPIEQYVLGEIVGKGSYGEVTLARNKRDKKQYVIKKIDLHNASDKERLFAKQEVDILSKLRHPNIVSYKESFQTNDGCLSIVMGYCENGDLYTHLKKQVKLGEFLTETKIVEWFVQISMALQYMHDRHILHRDLKTQNIFLTKSKIIKLGDLGIARVLENNCDMATTMIGTPYYMSPELFSNKPYNHKSDVWALGCCLYEMATLKHAFNARDMNALVYKILKGKIPDMPENYSTDLHEITKAMLNSDPGLRPSAAGILRHPYIKKHIALFLEGTKNRRHQREEKVVKKEKAVVKENNKINDSGFCELNEDPQAIATVSKIEVNVLDVEKKNEQGFIKKDEICSCSKNDEINYSGSSNVCSIHYSNSREIPNDPKENNKRHSNSNSREVQNDPKENNQRHNNSNSREIKNDPNENNRRRSNGDNNRHIIKSPSSSCSSASGSIGDQNVKKDRSKRTRKILSDRIQAKARLKKQQIEEEKTKNNEVKISPTHVKSSSNTYQHEKQQIEEEKTKNNEVKISPTHVKSSPNTYQHEFISAEKDHSINLEALVNNCEDKQMAVRPKRQLPVLADHATNNKLPPPRFKNSDVAIASNIKNVANKEENAKVSAGVPNMSARKKRRQRQQERDSLYSPPLLIKKGPESAKSVVPYQAYTPRSKEEIIKEHLSRASSNPDEKDVVDGPSGIKMATPLDENLSEIEDTLTGSDRCEKSGDVACLIDTLQATLIMGSKSKGLKSPECSLNFDDLDENELFPSASGRLKERIKLLRKECIAGIGETALLEAYNIINTHTEDNVETSLINLIGKAKFEEFGGQIWQLKFCEEF